MRAQVLICCQPMPNSPQSSRCALLRPIAVIVSRVQALALAMLGEPVSRGPMPSINASLNCMALPCPKASARMRAYMFRSMFSTAGCGP